MTWPIRWYWAAATSFVAVYVTVLVWVLLTNGPLHPAFMRVRSAFGTFAAEYVVDLLWVLTPPFAVGLGTYEWLRRPARAREDYLRCLKCGYILKGLSEPRCPECGERI